MKYIHVKNLEKYHPGYKERDLIWCRAYFKMLNSDPEFELLCEIDKWRFMAFIMLELQLKEPIPINPEYLERKGFNLKTRPIQLTIKMLHGLIEVCNAGVTHIREEKRREYKEEKRRDVVTDSVTNITESTYLGNSKILYVRKIFLEGIKKTYDYINIEHEFKKMEGWLIANPGKRTKYKNWEKFIVNWLNRIEKPIGLPKLSLQAPALTNVYEKIDEVERKKVADLVHKTATDMRGKKNVSK